MTDHDKELIDEARYYPPSYWGDIDELIEQADTEEAKEKLRRIQISLYHADEYRSGML